MNKPFPIKHLIWRLLFESQMIDWHESEAGFDRDWTHKSVTALIYEHKYFFCYNFGCQLFDLFNKHCTRTSCTNKNLCIVIKIFSLSNLNIAWIFCCYAVMLHFRAWLFTLMLHLTYLNGLCLKGFTNFVLYISIRWKRYNPILFFIFFITYLWKL